jgi:hypothetical protein
VLNRIVTPSFGVLSFVTSSLAAVLRSVSVLKEGRLHIKLKVAESDADQPEELLWPELDSFSQGQRNRSQFAA